MKAIADSGTATITATNNGKSATCTITATPKTEVSTYTFDLRTTSGGSSASATEDSSKTLTGSNTSRNGDTYGWLFGTSAYADFPVFTKSKVTVYVSYKQTGDISLYEVTDGNVSATAAATGASSDTTDKKTDETFEKVVLNYSGTSTTARVSMSAIYVAKIVVEKTN